MHIIAPPSNKIHSGKHKESQLAVHHSTSLPRRDMEAAESPRKYSKMSEKNITLSKSRVKFVVNERCTKILPATNSTRFQALQSQFGNSTFGDYSPFLLTSRRAS